MIYNNCERVTILQSGGTGPAGPGGADLTPGHVKLVKRGNKMEVLL